MPFTFVHTGDLHLEEDHYFADTAHCIEWFVEDSIQQGTGLFVLDGDLTTYRQTIKERKFWVDAIVRMANHAPVVLIAGNHGKELEDDLYPLAKVKGKNPVFLATEPVFIDLDDAAIAVFPYPRKAEFMSEASGGSGASLAEAFAGQLQAFNEQFDQRPGAYRLFFGHFGVAGARVSGGQPLAGRCAEYPLEPLRNLEAQYAGLSHIHLRQQLLPRVWYAGSLSRCDYSETEEKGYHLVRLGEPMLQSNLSDVEVEFRGSPTRSMVELHAAYEGGEFRFDSALDANRLKDSRVKVVVTVPSELHSALSREEQERLKRQLLAASPAELKVKIEHEAEEAADAAPLCRAKSAEAKLLAYWALKGDSPEERREPLLAKLGQVEAAVISQQD